MNTLKAARVATREGGVDRNVHNLDANHCNVWVATREGGVDRNLKSGPAYKQLRNVATREGGVDRNTRIPESAFKELGRHPRGWRG